MNLSAYLQSNAPVLELDHPLSGAKCRFGISHSLYNQQKKVILYEKQYINRTIQWIINKKGTFDENRYN
jgi:hypothetical protein